MNCLMHFWFIGTFHKKRLKSVVYFYQPDYDENDHEYNVREAGEYLSCMINKGLVDCECTSAVRDFGVISVDYNVDYQKGVSISRSMYGLPWNYQPKK
jgi:hypothetical protein